MSDFLCDVPVGLWVRAMRRLARLAERTQRWKKTPTRDIWAGRALRCGMGTRGVQADKKLRNEAKALEQNYGTNPILEANSNACSHLAIQKRTEF
jgi:hypothetical protein